MLPELLAYVALALSQKFSCVESLPFVPSVLPTVEASTRVTVYRVHVVLIVTACPAPLTLADGEPPVPKF